MTSQKLLDAIKSLLADINSMRPRRGLDEENEHWFEGFPEFYVEKSDNPSDYGQEFVSVEWPNLSISAKWAEEVLADMARIAKENPKNTAPCPNCGKPMTAAEGPL